MDEEREECDPAHFFPVYTLTNLLQKIGLWMQLIANQFFLKIKEQHFILLSQQRTDNIAIHLGDDCLLQLGPNA